MESRSARLFIQTAAVVFFLNSVSAYGACCLMVSESDTVELPPCHQVQEDDKVEDNAECCLACVPALQMTSTLDSSVPVLLAQALAGNVPSISSEPDPPYRPPIVILS